MIVVDTSVLINLFRGIKTEATAAFKSIEQDDVPFMLPAICCQELLQGAKNQKEWMLLSNYLLTQEILYPKDEMTTYQGAAKIYFDLRRQGVTIRSTIDCLVAQQVLEYKHAKLLHDDVDFTNIAKKTPLICF